MAFRNVKDDILKTLKDLKEEQFTEFCTTLTECAEPRIRAAEVENKSRRDVVNLLVSRCTENKVLPTTISTLRAMGCNNEALKLETKHKPQLKMNTSVSEPDSSPGLLRDQDNQAGASGTPPSKPRTAKDIIKSNKVLLLKVLSGDYDLILNKVHERKLVTDREYRNLRAIHKGNVEEHVIELIDKLIGKGEDTCHHFCNLLETDDDVKETYPDLKSIHLSRTRPPCAPVQETRVTDHKEDGDPKCKKAKKEEFYPVSHDSRGICLVLNNINFEDGRYRGGTEKDADDLGKIFSWLGFRVLMRENLTVKEMSRVLSCFSTLSDISEVQELRLKEWCEGFVDLQEPQLHHGDVFICCILSHGDKGVVHGTDLKELAIKDITRTFKASNSSLLIGKPKVFFIQACQGKKYHHGVKEQQLVTDEGPSVSVPEEADVLVALATVEDYVSFRNTVSGSWFIQSLCEQLKDGCLSGDDLLSILTRVNSEVSKIEGTSHPGLKKQMPEVRHTLTNKLMLSPLDN